MEISGYSIKQETTLHFDDAIKTVTEKLNEEGFGIINRIDFDVTFKKKIDKSMPKYTVLGACNPKLAFHAIQMEPEIGLLLPCNVLIYEKGDKVVVAAMNPEKALSVAQNAQLTEMASEVIERLKKVIRALGD